MDTSSAYRWWRTMSRGRSARYGIERRSSWGENVDAVALAPTCVADLHTLRYTSNERPHEVAAISRSMACVTATLLNQLRLP
jgi:hypothetical protein